MRQRIEITQKSIREIEVDFYYTIKEITAIRKQVIDRNLKRPDYFDGLTIKELQRISNGCGPDWMCELGRDFLSWKFETFEAAVMVHDVRFEFSDGTEKSFDEVNDELYSNCKSIVSQDYSWWRPIKKASKYLDAQIIYQNCDKFGWGAWAN